jgi:hypothetical protein
MLRDSDLHLPKNGWGRIDLAASASTGEDGPLAANSRASRPFFLCPRVCHLVASWTLCCGIHGHIADGFRAGRTVGVTAEFSTDGTDGARWRRVLA